jgi:hypothetical protein
MLNHNEYLSFCFVIFELTERLYVEKLFSSLCFAHPPLPSPFHLPLSPPQPSQTQTASSHLTAKCVTKILRDSRHSHMYIVQYINLKLYII